MQPVHRATRFSVISIAFLSACSLSDRGATGLAHAPLPAKATASSRSDSGGAGQNIEWQTYIDAGNEAYERGEYEKAEKLLKAALREAEGFASDDARLALSLNNLAALYADQAKYAPAEPLYKRSLAIDEKAYGPDHPEVATDLNNLASLYDDQGQYAQAEPLYQRSLAIREKALGPDHPDVAQSLNNLALLYDTQGQYAQAEPLYKRSLTIFEKALGPDHPDVATTLENMAGLYRAMDRAKEAAPLEARAQRIRKSAEPPKP